MKNNFIQKARIKHENTFDYSKVNYVDAHSKIIIICPIHGEFEQTPTNHLQGQGCPKCGIEKSRKTRSSNLDSFCVKVNLIHHNRYDYSKVNYINNHTKIVIICPIHGEFKQTPQQHLCKKGCPSCGVQNMIKKLSKNTGTFICQSHIIHDKKYDYSKVEYVNAFTKVIIICPQHGDFSQQPVKHLVGQGCPKCFHHISKSEIEWLDSLSMPNEYRHKTLKINGKNYMVDAYDPTNNTIYEFYGDYWHGNPQKYKSDELNMINKKSFGTLYLKTVERENKIIQAGYKLITIWEMDFKQ